MIAWLSSVVGVLFVPNAVIAARAAVCCSRDYVAPPYAPCVCFVFVCVVVVAGVVVVAVAICSS